MMLLLLTLLCLAAMCSSTAIFTPIAIPTVLSSSAQGLTITSNGRYMVIADTNSQCIRVLDMNSPASWLATIGNGTKSYGDGLNSTSLVAFNNPSGVAVVENSSGSPQTILVADSSNSCIRSISWTTWVVSTIAGNAVDGIGSNARFNNPKGIALVGNDTLYIVDNSNSNIRKLIILARSVSLVAKFDTTYPGVPVYITAAPGGTPNDLVLWVSHSNSDLNKIAVSRLHVVKSNVVTTTISNYSGGAGIVACPRNGRYWVYAGSSFVTGVVAVLNEDASTALNNTGINASAKFTGLALNSSSNAILAISGQKVGYLSGFTSPPQPSVLTDTATLTSTSSSSLLSSASFSSTSTVTDEESQSGSNPTLSPSPSTTLSSSVFTSPVVWARAPFKTLSIASPSVTPSLPASPSNSSLRGGEAFVTRYTQTSASSSSSPSMLTLSPSHVTSSPILYTSTTTTIPITIYVTRSHTKHKNSDHNTRIPQQTATLSSSQEVVAFPTRSVVHPPHRPPPPFRDRTTSCTMTITTGQPDNPSNNTTPVPAAVSTPTSDAAGVTVTAVTGAAAIVSAAASTGASIALLSSLGSCDDERPKDTVLVYVLSPFYSLGAVAIALGNVGLGVALTALHALLVLLHHRYAKPNYHNDADYSHLWVGHYHRSMQALRFPTLSLRVWQLMLPGAVFGAVVCIAGDDVHIQGISNLGAAPNVAAGVMALLVVIAYHALDAYFMLRLVLPSMVFAAWPQNIATTLLRSPGDRILLPEGRWVPNSIAELVAVPLLPMRTARLSQLRFFALLMTYVLSCCSALSRSASASNACSAFPLLLAVLYILHALVLVVLQPHRNPAAAPATDLCFSAICVLKYANANSDASSTLQLFLSVIMVVSTVHSLWVRYRLSLALGREEDDDGGQGGGKEIPLIEIMSDVDSSHAITGHSTTDTPPLHYAATAPHVDEHMQPMLGTHVKDVVSIAIVGSVQPATFDTVLQQQRKVQQHDNSSRVQSNSTATTTTSVVMPPPPPSVKQIARSEWPSVAPSDIWVDDTDL